MKTTDKTGRVVGALTVIDNDEIMLLTQQGQMVRTPVKDIREAGRNTMGVKLINLTAGDKLTAIARVISETDEPRRRGEAGLNVHGGGVSLRPDPDWIARARCAQNAQLARGKANQGQVIVRVGDVLEVATEIPELFPRARKCAPCADGALKKASFVD